MNLNKQVINQVISLLPEISKLTNINTSRKNICNYLLSNYSIQISEIQLNNLIHKFKTSSLKLKYKSLKLFIPNTNEILYNDILKYSLDDYFENSFSVTLSSIDVNNPINNENIFTIVNPVHRIYAKWISRLFNVSNINLLSNIKLSSDQIFEINQIPLIIDDVYDKIVNLLNTKIMLITFNGDINNGTEKTI
jgi:hypothetical protein